MRKILLSLLPVCASFLCLSAVAQSKVVTKASNAVNNTNATVSQASNAINQTTNTVNSAVQGVKSIKGMMSGLFPKKNKGGDVIIAIAGIEYDDENLSTLKESIRKVKGVKDIDTDYKGGTAFINVNFKGDGSDLWDKLPKEDKKLFKLAELADGNLIIEYKKAKEAEVAEKSDVTKGTN